MKKTICVLLSAIFAVMLPLGILAEDETFPEITHTYAPDADITAGEVTVYEKLPDETPAGENPSEAASQSAAETEDTALSTPEFFTLPLADNETPDGFVYEMADESSGIIITSYKGSLINLEIPSEINGHKVTAVKEYAFYRNYLLASVSFPETVVSIGHHAFAECENLVKIALPSELVSIGNEAFVNCRMLLSFTLPEGLETVGDEAFRGCLMMRKLKIPASVTYIGKDAFLGCENLSFDCSENSYAQSYANDNNIRLAEDTTGTVNLVIIFGSLLFALILYIAYRIVRSGKDDKKS